MVNHLREVELMLHRKRDALRLPRMINDRISIRVLPHRALVLLRKNKETDSGPVLFSPQNF